MSFPSICKLRGGTGRTKHMQAYKLGKTCRFLGTRWRVMGLGGAGFRILEPAVFEEFDGACKGVTERLQPSETRESKKDDCARSHWGVFLSSPRAGKIVSENGPRGRQKLRGASGRGLRAGERRRPKKLKPLERAWPACRSFLMMAAEPSPPKQTRCASLRSMRSVEPRSPLR